MYLQQVVLLYSSSVNSQQLQKTEIETVCLSVAKCNMISFRQDDYLLECYHEWLNRYNTADATISHWESNKHKNKHTQNFLDIYYTKNSGVKSQHSMHCTCFVKLYWSCSSCRSLFCMFCWSNVLCGETGCIMLGSSELDGCWADRGGRRCDGDGGFTPVSCLHSTCTEKSIPKIFDCNL